MALVLAHWADLDVIPLSTVCSPRCCHCCDRNRTVDLEQTLKTETIFALIESPSDQHQRHARRYIRQMSAVYIPLFDKSQRLTHRYSTNVSGIHPAIFDKVDVLSYILIQRVLAYTFSRHLSPTIVRQFAPQLSGIYRIQKRPSLNLHQKRICANSADRFLEFLHCPVSLAIRVNVYLVPPRDCPCRPSFRHMIGRWRNPCPSIRRSICRCSRSLQGRGG